MRAVRTGVLTAGLVAVAVLGLAGPASAHDAFVSSNPAPGAVLRELPEAFSVTMNEALVVDDLNSAGFAIQVTDASDRYYGDGCLTFVDGSMNMGASLGQPGEYTFTWRLVSADSHPVSSNDAPPAGPPAASTFTWSPADGTTVSTGSATAPVCGDPEPATTVVGAASTSTPEATPTPEPTMTTQTEPTPEATATAAADSVLSPTLLWIGGAVLAVILAVGVTLLLVKPRPKA